MPGVPGFPPGAFWRAVHKKPPAEAGGLRVTCLPAHHAFRFRGGTHAPSCGMAGGLVFMPGVPGFPPGAFWRAVHKKPPAEAGGLRVTCLPAHHAFRFRCGTHAPSCGMAGGLVFISGVPGFPPGAFWRAVHKKPPAEAGGLRVACLPAHHAFRFRCGTHAPSCGMAGGVMVERGVPGFPPGAAWDAGGRRSRRQATPAGARP